MTRVGQAIATLPMYDWPELRPSTDRLWKALREAIRTKGLNAPEQLDRTFSKGEEWVHPDLLLSQTCGMPYRLGLHEKVELVGTPDYALADCPSGYYCSVLVVRTKDFRTSLEAFHGATFAFNAHHSESGYAAPLRMLAPLLNNGCFFAAELETGGHRGSIRAVANGEADLAAIDAVSWRLAEKFELEVGKLQIVGKTEPTPGLPLITALGKDAEMLAEAVAEGITALDALTREALGLAGFVRIPKQDYLAVS
jgi:ABC-type phosphate/phosphonate transport system substrate-binding protein